MEGEELDPSGGYDDNREHDDPDFDYEPTDSDISMNDEW
jgi:hypothetical protein